MQKGKCPGCKEIKFLTKHSKTGGHQPPFKRICRKCHDDEHDIKPNKGRRNAKKFQKYQLGTPKHKRK